MTMEVTFRRPFADRGVDQVPTGYFHGLSSGPDFKCRLAKTLKLTCEAPGASVSNQLQHGAEMTFVAFRFGHFASTPVCLFTLQEQQSLDLTFKDPKGQAVTGYHLELKKEAEGAFQVAVVAGANVRTVEDAGVQTAKAEFAPVPGGQAAGVSAPATTGLLMLGAFQAVGSPAQELGQASASSSSVLAPLSPSNLSDSISYSSSSACATPSHPSQAFSPRFSSLSLSGSSSMSSTVTSTLNSPQPLAHVAEEAPLGDAGQKLANGYELERIQAFEDLAREAKRGGLPPPQFVLFPNAAELEAEIQAVAGALGGR